MTDEAEFSECVVYDKGDHVELEWTAHGHRRSVLAAEEVVVQWAESENQRRAAEAELVVLREQLAGAATLLRDLHSFTMRHMAHSRWYHELPVADARAFLAGLENRGGSR